MAGPLSLAIRTFDSEAHGETQEAIRCPLCGNPQGSGKVVLWARDLLFRQPGRYPLVRC